MARFIDETGGQWAEGRIRGLDFAEGVYGKVCAVERDGLTLVAKGFKRFEGERGFSGPRCVGTGSMTGLRAWMVCAGTRRACAAKACSR